ncbi:hypothetical protein RSO68_09415 [Halomonas saccharevitans]|uniref:Adhesin n=1 Tax=Halomonas saccharevitans TaxID=416872 RepID=A0ABU3NGF2_9GAMM|nr:hypothetical protein [Halomonas saccharevitans]MDT8879690.1 hypothetical protein [Halomonas saccharevitans]
MSVNDKTTVSSRKGAFEGFAPKRLTARHRARGVAAALMAAGLSTLFTGAAGGQAWGQEGLSDEVHHRVFTSYRAASIIDGNSLSNVQGAINVNMAAGSQNLQSNAGVIAMGENALASNIVVQIVTTNNRLVPEQASAVIEDRALSQAVGWISVNQVAGQENVQSNTLSVALGIRGSSLSSETLGQVLSRTQEPTEESEDTASSRRVAIDETAFAGSRGVIQVNQSAGRGNATGNHVGIRMTSGARR